MFHKKHIAQPEKKKNSTCAHRMRLMLNRLNTSTSCDSVCKESGTHTQIHAEWVILKPKICLAPTLFWHSIWQSFKSLLHPLVEPKHQKKQTTAVGIKVSVGVRAHVRSSYLQHSAFCSLRIFMAVRYAENLTLFKSAKGGEADREIKGKWTKKKTEAENWKTKRSRNLPSGQHEKPLHSVKSDFC